MHTVTQRGEGWCEKARVSVWHLPQTIALNCAFNAMNKS